MTILALCLSVVLGALAALHFLWGIGFWVPIRDEARLVATVVGFANARRMPGPIPCGLVTVALVSVIWCIWWAPPGLRRFALPLMAAVFLSRGLLAFLPFWRRITPQEPFASYDRRFYGPLCLGLGVGLIVLWV